MNDKMQLPRIGDRLDKRSQDGRKSFLHINDNLSIRIFNPDLPKDRITEYLIQSQSTISPEDSAQLIPLFQGLGDYERYLAGKLLNPPRKVILLIGPLGSGKSTTLFYVKERLNRMGCNECLGSQSCQSRRIIPVINLNEDQYQTHDEEQAKSILQKSLTENIRAVLNINGVPTHQDELMLFWDKQLQKLRENFVSTPAFIWIASELSDHKSLDEKDENFKRRFQARETILNEMKKDRALYLDYLMRLWGFASEEYYGGNKSCSFIVFDNIDKATTIVQSMMVSILDDCAGDPGPAMIVALREETRDRFGLGKNKGSLIMDVVMHQGVKPSAVVLDRFERFINKCEDYFEPNDGMTKSEFEQIYEYLSKVYKLINPDNQRQSPYLTFLDHACGKSVRLALLCAENLLKVSIEDMRDPKFSAYSLIRTTVVNQAYSQFRATVRSPIPNLFDVKGYYKGRLLIKPRVLTFLKNCEGNRTTLNVLRRTLKGFGYSETTLIKDTVQEMQNIYCQLIRSDGFDFYESEREFLMAGNQKITLTEIGLGYIEHIMNSIDYLQEVMLDCRIPEDWLSQEFGFSTLPEKFSLLVKFLRELLEEDRKETQKFCYYFSRNDFYRFFGSDIITIELIYRSFRSFQKIKDAINRDAPGKDMDAYREVAEQFRSLVLLAARYNEEVLGNYPLNIERDKSLYT